MVNLTVCWVLYVVSQKFKSTTLAQNGTIVSYIFADCKGNEFLNFTPYDGHSWTLINFLVQGDGC